LVYKRISQQSIVKLDLMVPNGVYLIRVNNGEGLFSQRVTVNSK
jgi:hypothetical protein